MESRIWAVYQLVGFSRSQNARFILMSRKENMLFVPSSPKAHKNFFKYVLYLFVWVFRLIETFV